MSAGPPIPSHLVSTVTAVFMDELEAGLGHLHAALALADPESLDGAQATKAAEQFCEIKRMGEAGMALFGRRVETSGAYSHSGHRSAAEWLGQAAGESPGRAKGRLEVAARAAEVPALGAALRAGEISGEQARVIAGVAALDAVAAAELVAVAPEVALAALSEKATVLRHRALSDEAHAHRKARVHRGRYLRAGGVVTGGVRIGGSVPEVAWARCHPRLEAKTEEYFRRGRAAGEHESRDAYRADALVDLLCGSEPGSASGPTAMVQLRVDVESLQRGRTEGDEVCEIEGVGPVPVATARDLLGDCVFELLVKDGCDVVNLTGHGRNVPTRLRTAVLRRDVHCRWPRCSEKKGLEEHHWRLEAHKGELATMETLVALCKRHHNLCTYGGWRIEPDGEGGYRPVPPPEPTSAHELARKRRLTALEAKTRRRSTPGRGASPPANGPPRRR